MSRRQALGLLLVVLLLAAGRVIRHTLLVGSGGRWRDPLWLDSLLPAPPVETPAPASALELTEPVWLNVCAAETLRALPGIGPVLVDRILAARAAGIRFTCPADLQRIKGIGPRLAERLAPYLHFRSPPGTPGPIP